MTVKVLSQLTAVTILSGYSWFKVFEPRNGGDLVDACFRNKLLPTMNSTQNRVLLSGTH